MHCSEQLLETTMKAVAECFASVNDNPLSFEVIDSTVTFMITWLQEYCEPIKDRISSSLPPYIINLASKLAICQRPLFMSSLLEKQAIHYYRTGTELFVGIGNEA